MRVLCLHPAASSAVQLSKEFSKLEERLWAQHGIELVFIDAPLLDVNCAVGKSVGGVGGGINALDFPSGGGPNIVDGAGKERVSRRWYIEESVPVNALPRSNDDANSPKKENTNTKYAGLDASLLHLSQIWTRGGANCGSGGENNTSSNAGWLPFHGVLGVGQGADVAGILPLLNYSQNDDENDDSDHRPTMFEGLQFVALIDGHDILHQRDKNDENDVENDLYVGPDGVKSLHIIMEADASDDEDPLQHGEKRNERLAKQYGPNAEIHHIKLPKQNIDSHETQQHESIQHQCSHSDNFKCTPALLNILGKFLVSQKNSLRSHPTSRRILSLQTQLAHMEQLATLAIANEISLRPPKALMAVIGPTAMMSGDIDNSGTNGGTESSAEDRGIDIDMEANRSANGTSTTGAVEVTRAVGAWQGPKRRGIGEEGGGAPCPEDFLKREDER